MKYKVGDRIIVNNSSSFSRGSVGTITKANSELGIFFSFFEYYVKRDRSTAEMGFRESELDPYIDPLPPPRSMKNPETWSDCD